MHDNDIRRSIPDFLPTFEGNDKQHNDILQPYISQMLETQKKFIEDINNLYSSTIVAPINLDNMTKYIDSIEDMFFNLKNSGCNFRSSLVNLQSSLLDKDYQNEDTNEVVQVEKSLEIVTPIVVEDEIPVLVIKQEPEPKLITMNLIIDEEYVTFNFENEDITYITTKENFDNLQNPFIKSYNFNVKDEDSHLIYKIYNELAPLNSNKLIKLDDFMYKLSQEKSKQDIIIDVKVEDTNDYLGQIEAMKLPKEEYNFNLTDHQQDVCDRLLQTINQLSMKTSFNTPADRMLVLEGAAGTGKTYTMDYILSKLTNKKIVFCSPTHQALKVIRQNLMDTNINFVQCDDEYLAEESNLIIKTLASFLCIKMNRDLENGVESFIENPKKTQLNCDILCIDESSMISKDQIKLLIKKLGINFKMILFVGDEPQLSSPSDDESGNGLFDLPLKFSLEQVVRQKEGSQLLNIAWWIRDFIKRKDVQYYPSQLLNENINNGYDVIITRDQNKFFYDYWEDNTDKVIGTYTNKITNEYNKYVRNILIQSQQHKQIDIYPYVTDINDVYKYKDYLEALKENPDNQYAIEEISKLHPKTLQQYINQETYQQDYKEFYVGESLVCIESNQKNDDVIHQNGEIFTIRSIVRKTYSQMITKHSTELYAQDEMLEYKIDYWNIIDTKFREINIIVEEHQDLFIDMCKMLWNEASKSTHAKRYSKYYKFKTKFTKVNYLNASTLHKLQGSTVESLYVDARDLDKFYKMSPITMYKLIYVAITRAKLKVIILV